MITTVSISWVILISALILLGLKVWLWLDSHNDWENTKRLLVNKESAVYIQTRGLMRSAWLMLIDGFLWSGLAFTIFITRYSRIGLSSNNVNPLLARVIILVMIWMEIAKIGSELVTRIQIFQVTKEAVIR